MIEKAKNHMIYYFHILTVIIMDFVFHINSYAAPTESADSANVAITPSAVVTPMTIDGGEGGAEEELKNFLVGDNGLMTFVSQAGWVLIAFGIGQIILSFKDDNPESKSRGIMLLLGGVFCVAISGILSNLGVDL